MIDGGKKSKNRKVITTEKSFFWLVLVPKLNGEMGSQWVYGGLPGRTINPSKKYFFFTVLEKLFNKILFASVLGKSNLHI